MKRHNDKKYLPENIVSSGGLDANHILKLLQSKNNYVESVRSFQYAFVDVAEPCLLSFIDELLTYPINTDDRNVAKLIYKWYSNLDVKERIGFKMTKYGHQLNKANNIVNIITSIVDRQSLKGRALLDVGAGSCALTGLVGVQLNMSAVAIDIETEINWGGADDVKYSHGCTKHIYDGHNLLGTLKSEKFQVVMYNHSLHHFSSLNAQVESIKQIAQLLDPKGILFISEHLNDCNNDILDLVHILLNIRYNMDTNQINSEESASNTVNVFKYACGRSNYLSNALMCHITESFGLQLCAYKSPAENDITKTSFYCFTTASEFLSEDVVKI